MGDGTCAEVAGGNVWSVVIWNVQIHDKVAGLIATLRKEAIQGEIEEQMDQGGEGLLNEDQ